MVPPLRKRASAFTATARAPRDRVGFHASLNVHAVPTKADSDDSFVLVEPAFDSDSAPLPSDLHFPIPKLARDTRMRHFKHPVGSPLALGARGPTMAGTAVNAAKASLQLLRVLAASQPLPFVRGVAEMALTLVEATDVRFAVLSICFDVSTESV